jgi:hypothetical protein
MNTELSVDRNIGAAESIGDVISGLCASWQILSQIYKENAKYHNFGAKFIINMWKTVINGKMKTAMARIYQFQANCKNCRIL